MAQLVDQAILDDKGYLVALKRMDAGVAKLTQDAQRGFDNVQKSAKSSGVQIGAVSGVVSAVTTELINLGKAGVDALIQIGEQSIQTAIEIDTLKARLGGIFDGSQEAADQAFTFIQAKSRELGIDLSELAGAFLPKTESLAQFERVAKIATALARSDPEQGAIGARIALIEALSGTFTSLQRRFEIPKDDINAIKQAFDARGIEGFLEVLETILDKSGKSFDDLANTAQTAFSKLQISAEQILGRVGIPIVESLEQAANKLNEFISANEDNIIVFADTIGRAVADAIDFITSIDFSQFDTQSLIEFADYIFRLVNATQLVTTEFIEWAGAIYQVADAVTPLGEVLDYLAYLFSNIDQALITGAQILAMSKAGYIGLYEGIQPVVEILGQLYEAASKALSGDFAGAADALGAAMAQSTQDLFDEVAAREAANAAILESQKKIEEYQQAVDGNTDSQQKLREELEATEQAGTGAADAILAAAQAEKQAAEDAEALAEAQAKVNEKMADAQKDFQRKLEDIDIETERKRLDIAIEFAQKREDAARDNVQKLEDIQRKYSQDVDDAATDLARKEEDIARKFGEQRIDLERENRQKRVDIEKEYRLQLKDIQRQFLTDAEEAERNRDAVAFLRAIRERDQKVQDAQITRTREIDEQRVTNQRKTEELRIQQQREVEEARIANERKLEDLRLNLERQIEAQNTAYARQLDDLAIGEQRKNEELALARERDIEDARRAYDRKLEDLRTALAAELALIEEFAAAKAAAEASAGTRTATSPSSRPSTTAGRSAGFGSNPGTIGGGSSSNRRFSSVGRRAGGGPVAAGLPYAVGERGPELFVPNQSGRIVPNGQFVGSVATSRPAINNISNIKQGSTVNVPDAAGLLNNPVAVRQIQNIVLQILGETG